MIFLILLYYFSISSTLPIPTGHPTLLPAVSNVQSILSRENSSNTRTIWNIIWSCFSTIFACAWVSVHPNIPDPKDSEWKIRRRHVMIMVYVLVIPEMVIIWAARQYRDARLLAKEFRNEGHPDWTKTHAFFLIMGGFTLYAQGKPLRVLEWTDFKALARSGEINWPDISEEQIKDRSKGDSLSKTIVVLQSTWFHVQFAARAISKLTVTELEVATAAYSLLTGIIYFYWWNKPLDVRFSVPVQLVEQTTGEDTSDNLTDNYFCFCCIPIDVSPTILEGEEAPGGDQIGTDSDNLSSSYPPSFPSSRPTLQNSGSNFVPTMITHPSLEQLIQVDRPRGPTTSVNRKGFYLVRNYCRECGIFIRHNLVKVFSVFSLANQLKGTLYQSLTLKTDTRKPNDNPLHNGLLSVPTFYSYTAGSSHLSSLIDAIFVSIISVAHIVAWSLQVVFPTSLEKWGWRISTLIISAAPLMIVLSIVMMASGAKIVDKPIFNFSYNVLCLAYITARIVLLLLALISLRALPPGTYIEFDWVTKFPHI